MTLTKLTNHAAALLLWGATYASLPTHSAVSATSTSYVPGTAVTLGNAALPAGNDLLLTHPRATSGRAYAVATLQQGVKHYTDRNYIFTSVPDQLQQAAFIMTPNDDKRSTSPALLTFELAHKATLYVAFDPRAAILPAWLHDWKAESFTLGTSDYGSATFDLYSKSFEPGQITLGGALVAPAAGTEMNYLVIGIPAVANDNGNPDPEAPVVLRINSGGGAVTANNQTFQADEFFTGSGKSYANNKIADIQGTTQDAIYLSERSTTQDLGTFGYAIPVTNGTYTVKLHFAEIYWGATGGGAGGAGKRVFDVRLEGHPILSDFDIHQEVGTMTAVVKTFTAEVNDQQLDLSFTASVNQPKLSALEILGQGQIMDEPVTDPCAWSNLANSALSKVEAQSAKVNGKLYVLAGFLSGLKVTGTTEIYDPATNQWSTGAPMPTPVTHMGTTVVGNDIWVVAGFVGNHPGKATAKVQVYNTTTNTWREGPSLPNPRGSGAAVYNKGKLHFFGGLLPDRKTDVGEHYVLDLNHLGKGWQLAAPMPNPRNHLSGASVGGMVYAIGGQYGHDAGVDDQKFLHMYDPATNQWNKMADLPSDRSHFEPGTIVHNGKIIIVGGRRGGYFFEDITEYDPEANIWTERCKLPAKLLAPAAAVFYDRLIVANGGENGTCCPLNKTRWIPIEPAAGQPAPVLLVLEAENARLSGAKKASNHAGYSGTGFADYTNAQGDFVEWAVTVPAAGNYALSFTYALSQGNRPLTIAIDGDTVASALSFPQTGSWQTWQKVESAAYLTVGTHQVRATATGKSGANIDFLTVQQSANQADSRLAEISQQPILNIPVASEAGQGLQLYPNPAEDQVTLTVEQLMLEVPARITATDVQGYRLFEQEVTVAGTQLSYKLDTHLWPAGVYLIEVRQGPTVSIRKLVKH